MAGGFKDHTTKLWKRRIICTFDVRPAVELDVKKTTSGCAHGKKRKPHTFKTALRNNTSCATSTTRQLTGQLFAANLLKRFCHRRRVGGRPPLLARLRDRDKDQGPDGSLWLRCLSCIKRRTRPPPGTSSSLPRLPPRPRKIVSNYLFTRTAEMRWRDRDNGAKWTQWWKTADSPVGNADR